jgi:hypothetical protein
LLSTVVIRFVENLPVQLAVFDLSLIVSLGLIFGIRPLKTGTLRHQEAFNEVTLFFLLIAVTFFSDEALRMSDSGFIEIR